MIRRLTALALLLAAGCGQQDAPAPQANQAAEAPKAEASVPVLEGEWQVVSIDGKPLAAAMTASFTGGKARLASGCLRRAWNYSQKRNTVSFTPDPGGSANCGGGTSGEQESAYAALEQANIVIFNKDGAEASLSGTGGNLSLQRR